jgi:hypothetical protein
VYRSGDLGRLLPSGEIEHLGRLDDQVKIRGHRLDLGEVRSQLLAMPAVTSAAVVVRRRGGVSHVDAYVTGTDLNPGDLMRGVAARLPSFAMPSSIVVVDELPLTRNGKVDVARLPPTASVAACPSGPPQFSPLEELVAGVWAEALGGPAGPDDNLFLIGGNSVVAATIAHNMARAGLGRVPVRDIYLNPTVRQLAAALARSGSTRSAVV